MRRLVCTSIAMLAFLCLQSSAIAASSEGARLDMRETSFEFKEAFEGEKVSHDFMVKNSGKEVLNILKVTPG